MGEKNKKTKLLEKFKLPAKRGLEITEKSKKTEDRFLPPSHPPLINGA